ncbi:MAG: DEAD/DEAH box helicase, partial [Deltaproteobacteria bacterium]|nr:DEAD/DEAH box helicase [Deltaproteobacteria bacterium]
MGRKFRRKLRTWNHKKMTVEAEPVLKGIFAKIGKPALQPFRPDPFQLKATEAIQRTDCLVIAPTGAGKTWIAEQAILSVFNKGGKCWYASPLKALTNAKWVEFGLHFESHNVGILTGDTKENPDAPIIVGT